MAEPIRVGALISGGGTNLQAIIDACESGAIGAKMAFVGSDNPDARGLGRAQKHGIPHFVTDYRDILRRFKADPVAMVLPADADPVDIAGRQKLIHGDPAAIDRFVETRILAEAALLENMGKHPFDLLVLAGFMRNLTPYFIDRVNTDPALPRIMNIHPAILPAFPGVDGYGDTFRYGCKVGGCTVHFIDYGEDSGPIIGQKCFPILPGDDLAAVQKKGLEKEWELYPECIRLYAEKRLSLKRIVEPDAEGAVRERTVVKIAPRG